MLSAHSNRRNDLHVALRREHMNTRVEAFRERECLRCGMGDGV
jgi:hypothetical protein